MASSWCRIGAAMEAADGPDWGADLEDDCTIVVREQPPGPPAVIFRFRDRAFAAEAGRIVDMRREPDGSTVTRVLSPRGALLATVPTPAPGAASLN